MMNAPLEQQLLAGIEERNCVIERQYKRIEELESALRLHLAVSPDDPLLVEPLERKLAVARARIEELEAALLWIVNLHHGVSKFAGDGFHHGVTDSELKDALTAAQQALKEQP